MAVRPLEHTPVLADVPYGVGVEVPVHVPAIAEERGVPHEVDDAVDLVDRIELGIEGVGVDVYAVLVTPTLDRFGNRMAAVVFVQGDGSMGLCGLRRCGEDGCHREQRHQGASDERGGETSGMGHLGGLRDGDNHVLA